MVRYHRLLPMVQVGNMSLTRCERCNGRAIFIGFGGEWRCVICNPKVYKWNKKTMSYEE